MKINCPHCGKEVELKRSIDGYQKHGLNYFSELGKKSVAKRQAKAGGTDIMAAARAKRWPKKTSLDKANTL